MDYAQKPADYFGNRRPEIAALIEGPGWRILDVGCGCGRLGRDLLATGKASRVAGIELVPEQAAAARAVLNEVVCADVSHAEFPWQPESFDCVICADVLEHLADPWSVLRRLRSLLTENGLIIASLPNVRHCAVLCGLVFGGDWRYRADGVMDIAHLRFFTLRSSRRLFSEAGYELRTARPHFNGRRYAVADRLTFGLLRGFLAERWLLEASPQPGGWLRS